MDYYLNSHVKLVEDRLKSFGISDIRVDAGLAGGAPGSPAPYHCIFQVNYPSVEKLTEAMAAHGQELMADALNYTDATPIIQVSEIKL